MSGVEGRAGPSVPHDPVLARRRKPTGPVGSDGQQPHGLKLELKLLLVREPVDGPIPYRGKPALLILIANEPHHVLCVRSQPRQDVLGLHERAEPLTRPDPTGTNPGEDRRTKSSPMMLAASNRATTTHHCVGPSRLCRRFATLWRMSGIATLMRASDAA
jgi:hypothetical protein